jgi:pilus assembly protein CpaF
VHVGRIADLPARLEALGARRNGRSALARHVVSAIGVVVHVERGPDGIRRVVGFARPGLDGHGRLEMAAVP